MIEKEPGEAGKNGGRRSGVRKPTMKGNQCIPRLGRGGPRPVGCPATPSMLERLREAVLRMIMTSAISKTTASRSGGGAGGGGSLCSCPAKNRANYYSYDSHYDEAVADCIDFIKKSSASSSSVVDVVLASEEPVLEVLIL